MDKNKHFWTNYPTRLIHVVTRSLNVPQPHFLLHYTHFVRVLLFSVFLMFPSDIKLFKKTKNMFWLATLQSKLCQWSVKKNLTSHMIGLEKMTDNSGSSEQLLREPFFSKMIRIFQYAKPYILRLSSIKQFSRSEDVIPEAFFSISRDLLWGIP